MTNLASPKRGEIWLVNFDPTVGAEIKKIRPAVVISSDGVGKLPKSFGAEWRGSGKSAICRSSATRSRVRAVDICLLLGS